QSWTVLLGPKRRGSWSHWHPERMRKMIPLIAFRQSAWCRPVALIGQYSSRIGRILCHRASETSQIVGKGLIFWVFLRLDLGLRRVVTMVVPSGATPYSYSISLSYKAVTPVFG